MVLIVIGNIGGCGGGGSGDGMEPGPLPEPGNNCNFIPDEAGPPYSQIKCSQLAAVFECEDFSFEQDAPVPCEVFGCLDCLCDASRGQQFKTDNADVCNVGSALMGCQNASFDINNICHPLDCVPGTCGF